MERHSSHSQKVPYARKEGRKSLLSKVKDSVKDILSPSWLSDLVTSSKPDSSTAPAVKDKDVFMSPVNPVAGPSTMQPPADFTPFQSQMPLGNGQPRTLNFGATPAGPASMPALPFQSSPPPPVSEFTSSQLPLARLTEKSDSVMANEDTMSQRSDVSKSTSGCSSMVPQAEVGRKVAADVAPPIDRSSPSERSPPSPTDQPANKRQRLQVSINSSKTWSRRLSDTISEQQQRPGAFNRPTFNSSLFGSPLTNESSLLGSSFHESSFYPGKTTFGGRSSFRPQKRKTDLNQSLPSRLSVPVKAFMKAKPRPGTSKEAVTSSTAKRILEALDKMPSPMNDAKRIPFVSRYWTESPMSRDQTLLRSGPPTNRLNVSSLASISRNRQVITSPPSQQLRTVSCSPQPSTSGIQAAQLRGARPSRQDTVVLDSGMAASGKVRKEKSYHRGSASARTPALEEQDTEIMPDLRTEFTLPVSAMPAINFSTLPKSGAAMPMSSAPASQNVTPGSLGTSLPKRPSFTFASPIAESEPKNKPLSPPTGKGFQFSSPISIGKDLKAPGTQPGPHTLSGATATQKLATISESASSVKSTVVNSAFTSTSPAQSNMKMAFTSSFSPKPKPKENGPMETGGGGFKAADELKQGSVMDILGGNKSTATKQPDLSTLFKPTGWTCDVCLINNKEAETKCVACQSARPTAKAPNTSSTAPVSEPAKSDLFAKFKQPTGSWTCDTCLISNKAEVDKCVACQTKKPGSSSAPAKSDLFSKFQQPSGSWTCDTCLIQNKSDVDMCLACQTKKPGVSASVNDSAMVSSHGSLMPGNWICSKCRIQNKKDAAVCGVCGTAKAASAVGKLSPVTSQSDSLKHLRPAAGQWECEVCLVQNKPDSTTCIACQTAKPAKFFKHPPGDWVCDTCLVNNKEADISCVACNYTRPGPPRTRAVPSCVKNFLDSKNSGSSSSVPESQSSSIKLNSAGGFQFVAESGSKASSSSVFLTGALASGDKTSEASTTSGTGFKFSGASATPTGSGFKFGASESKSDQSELGSGFKFGSSEAKSEQTSSGSGFKFGNAPVATGSDDSAPAASGSVNSKMEGGFKFGNVANSGEKPSGGANISFGGNLHKSNTDSTRKGLSVSANESKTSGFAFGSSNKTETKASEGGFQFGTSSLTTSCSSVNSGSLTTSAPSAASFVFGQKSEDKPKDSLNATTSVPGGFAFSSSSSVTSASSVAFPTGASSTGGFNFAPSGSKQENSSISAVPNQNSLPGFAFNAPKVSENNLKPETNALGSQSKSFGGFNFKPSEQKSGFGGGFNVAQATGQTNRESATKRGRDEDSGESSAKKQVINFGSSSSTPFQMGVTNSSTNASSPFVFGQQNSTPTQPASKATSNPNQAASFSFTAQKNDIGSASTSVPGLFNFGAKPAEPFSSGLGVGSGSFTGSGTSSVFNGSTPSTTLSFGATPLAFSATNVASTTAPAFGGGLAAAPAPTNPALFQFGIKPADATTQPGAPSTGFNFSSSLNPAGLGSAPNFNFTSGAAAGAMAFSAAPNASSEKRVTKRAVRRLKR